MKDVKELEHLQHLGSSITPKEPNIQNSTTNEGKQLYFLEHLNI